MTELGSGSKLEAQMSIPNCQLSGKFSLHSPQGNTGICFSQAELVSASYSFYEILNRVQDDWQCGVELKIRPPFDPSRAGQAKLRETVGIFSWIKAESSSAILSRPSS